MSDEAQDDPRTKRLAIRVANEDHLWLIEQAEDEGVEPATLVRMMISRLRKGRMPLIAMMEAGHRMAYPAVRLPTADNPRQTAIDEEADGIVQARLNEMDGAEVVPFPETDDIGDMGNEGEAVAIPLRRVERNRYNPGRQ